MRWRRSQILKTKQKAVAALRAPGIGNFSVSRHHGRTARRFLLDQAASKTALHIISLALRGVRPITVTGREASCAPELNDQWQMSATPAARARASYCHWFDRSSPNAFWPIFTFNKISLSNLLSACLLPSLLARRCLAVAGLHNPVARAARATGLCRLNNSLGEKRKLRSRAARVSGITTTKRAW